MASQRDWIPDVLRREARQQLEEAFIRHTITNPFPESAEEIETMVFNRSQNSKERYTAAMQDVMKRAESQQMTQFGFAPMPQGSPFYLQQGISIESPLSSADIGYSPDSRVPHLSSGSQFYSPMPSPLQPQQPQQPQRRKPDDPYSSSPLGSVASTYIPSNSQVSAMSPALRTPGSVSVDHSPAGPRQMSQYVYAPMPRGSPFYLPQGVSMQSPLSSADMGYSPDSGVSHPSPGLQFYSPMPSPLQSHQPQQPKQRKRDDPYSSSPLGSVVSTYIPSLSLAHPSNSPQVSAISPALRTPDSVSIDYYPAGLQQMRQPFPRGPRSDSPQGISKQSPLSSADIGYRPDSGLPRPSPGSQFYSPMPSPPQPQQPQQPQLRMPDSSYSSSPDGSVGSTYISSLSPACPSNSQVSAMSPALRTPGSVSVDHFPAVDDEASLQESLHDDIPHSSKQEGRSTSSFDQTIARLNRKRKHRTPSPTNPQDPTSSVELNDAQDPVDLFIKMFEDSHLENFVNGLTNDYKGQRNCMRMLEKMMDQEEDEREKQEMRTCLEAVRKFWLLGNLWRWNQITEDFCKTRIRKWITDGKCPPPPVNDVKFEKKDGKLVVTWTSPEWPFWISPYWPSSLRYCGECVESGGKKSVVEQFQNIAETSYELSNVSPICGYYVTVWAVNQNGQKGEENRVDLSIKEVENYELENFLNNLEKYPDVNRNCMRMLEKMMDQEEDEREKQEMMTVGKEVAGFLSSNQITKDFCKTQLRRWITDGKCPPLPVNGVKFEKKNGKLVVTWTSPEWPFWTSPKWPFLLRYYGECVESGGKKSVVEQFQNIAETSYELSNASPIRGYYVTVWAVNQNGQKGEERKSERVVLCTKHGDIYVDDTSPLRPNYEVYKGYLNSTSSTLGKVAVKIVQAKTSREVEALQALKHKNIVTYRLSKYYVDRFNKGWICVAMELCSTDTFQELVVGNKLNMHCCKISLLHMMLGLAAIHEAGFLHRDLKPQNILRSLGKDGKDGEDMKVADFGLCKQMDPNKSKVTKSVLEVGTEGWGSPEHYEPDAKMSGKSDIYSGGLVAAFGLSCGKHVYGSKAYDWKPSIIEDREMNLSILVCDNAEIAKDMVSKMLQRDPDNRPTAKQVLAHPFFWNDEKKLNFLHHMSSYFTPVIFGNVTCEHLTRIVMNDLDARKSIFWTKHRHVNWVDKMKETPGVCFRYRHVLLTARGEVYPYTRYNHTSVFDLIRFIRNVEEHYRDENFREAFDNMKCNVWKFFYKCFPTLLCTVYNAVYKHFPKVKYCREFPNDAAKFFTEPAHYEPLPPSS